MNRGFALPLTLSPEAPIRWEVYLRPVYLTEIYAPTMNNRLLRDRLQKQLFHVSSVLTARFPHLGAALLDSTLVPLVGNRLLNLGFPQT